jgi:hypothetical protein
MTETDARLNSHEAVCAERYDQINARLKRLEGIIIKACAVMLLSMAGAIWMQMNARIEASHAPVQISATAPR